MHADIHTLTKVFTGDVRFQVPMYQRPYVWNQEDQWDPLWSDIEALAERDLRELENATMDSNSRGRLRRAKRLLREAWVRRQQKLDL